MPDTSSWSDESNLWTFKLAILGLGCCTTRNLAMCRGFLGLGVCLGFLQVHDGPPPTIGLKT